MGKLVPCKTCGHEIDNWAEKCPKCGGQHFNGVSGTLYLAAVVAVGYFLYKFVWPMLAGG